MTSRLILPIFIPLSGWGLGILLRSLAQKDRLRSPKVCLVICSGVITLCKDCPKTGVFPSGTVTKDNDSEAVSEMAID